jgi:hypothetical protein
MRIVNVRFPTRTILAEIRDVVGRLGVEPRCSSERGILSPLRLPFRHRPITDVIVPLC